MIIRLLAAGALGISLALSVGCSGENQDPESVEVDSLDVDLMVDVHLAEARAELVGEPADSLRDEAFRLHAADSLHLNTLLAEYASEPERAVALYEKATEALNAERSARSILEE